MIYIVEDDDAIREHFAFEKRRHAARARRTVTNREGQ